MLKLLILLGFCLGALYLFGVFSPDPPTPKPTPDGWWGRGSKKPDADTSVKPFKVNVPDEVLKDLTQRLGNARLGEDLEESSFEYGFQVGYMKEVIEYWKSKFSWRKQEAILNKFPQFTTKIEGINVHFIHVKPASSGSGLLYFF